MIYLKHVLIKRLGLFRCPAQAPCAREIVEVPAASLAGKEAGTVFTFEPGLYYPERGLGVRLEDTVWADPEGGFEVLAEYPMDLVLKIAGA